MFPNKRDVLPRLKLIAQTGRVGSHIDVAACTERGIAVAEVDLDGTFRTMRAGMFHLRDRRPDVYGPLTDPEAPAKWQELAHA